MPTPTPDGQRLAEARAGLSRLLEQGREPKILDILRSLQTEILLNRRHGSTQEDIRRVLNEAGYRMSRSGFSYAFRMLLFENGLTGPNGKLRSLPSRPGQPRLVPPMRNQLSASAAHAPAISHLARPTLTEVLGKNI